MVFGLFGRKAAPVTQVDDVQKQLRTPSPSESISAVTGPPQSPELPPIDGPRGLKRSRSHSPTRPTSGDIQLPPADAGELLELIQKVPAKTLHSFVVTSIPNASQQEIQALIEFFATLTPPPKLHCVRCHKNYVEVENTDRSCLVPHDDESAEVEYVGNAKSKVAGVVGTTYETLWGCCNKLVEGDGDQGPPDGWCYEGFHTTDVKRARFRADSTPQADKLISCRRMRCFSQDDPAEGRARSQRAVAQKSLKEESDEEEDYDERELEREAAVLEGAKRQRKKSIGHQKRKSDANAMEIEADETQSVAGSSKSNAKDKEDKVGKATKPKPKSTKAESMKPKSAAAKSKTSVISVPPVQSPSTLPESSVPPRLDISGGDAEMTSAFAEQAEVRPKPKKPRKPRKTTDGGKYVPPKGEEESTDEEPVDIDRPKRKKRKSA